MLLTTIITTANNRFRRKGRLFEKRERNGARVTSRTVIGRWEKRTEPNRFTARERRLLIMNPLRREKVR